MLGGSLLGETHPSNVDVYGIQRRKGPNRAEQLIVREAYQKIMPDWW